MKGNSSKRQTVLSRVEQMRSKHGVTKQQEPVTNTHI